MKKNCYDLENDIMEEKKITLWSLESVSGIKY